VVLTQGLSFTLGPGKEECFYENVNQGTTVSIVFQVNTGGRNDIDLNVKGPDGRIIYQRRREQEGRYTFQAPLNGMYTVCFSNQMSSFSSKQISFDIDVGKETEKETEKPEDLSPLETSISQLSNLLATVQSEQKYLKMREIRHKLTTDSTNTRVIWWNIFEAFAVVGMSVFQIYYLKRFFEDKRTI
jgi:hypothetical protein